MVKTCLGTGVPRSPESNAPILSLCPPSFPSQPTCSGYLQWTVHVLPLSLLLLPPPAAPPLIGPHYLVTSHLIGAWEVSETWVGNDEEQLLELEGEESDGSVRAHEDDSDDEPENARDYLDLANFPVPEEPSSDEEGGGGKGGTEGSEKGSEEGGEEEREDSEEDVPLAQRKRKVARV